MTAAWYKIRMGFTQKVLIKACLVLGLLAMRAEARVFFVTDTNDNLNLTSLRGAIIAANSLRDEHNTIVLMGRGSSGRDGQAIAFRLTISGLDDSNSIAGDLDITHGVLKIESESKNVLIDAGGFGSRVFHVFPGAQLTIENLTITGGIAPFVALGSGDGENGGGIYNAGTLIVDHCIITNNSAGPGWPLTGAGGNGGGIYNSGVIMISDSAITHNLAGNTGGSSIGSNGGGIENDGYCIIKNSVISDNDAGDGGYALTSPTGGDGGNGGGIFNQGTMLLNECSVSGNAAGQGGPGNIPSMEPYAIAVPGGNGGDGGGIYNLGRIHMNYCSIYGNDSGNGGVTTGIPLVASPGGNGGDGAGIYNAGQLTINTCTISENLCGDGGYGDSAGGGGGSGGNGGGIYNDGPLELTSCTIALNQTGAGGNGGNAVSDTISGPISGGASGGDGGIGGGIATTNGGVGMLIRNTLIALNSSNVGGMPGTNTSEFSTGTSIGSAGASGFAPDAAGMFTSQGFNLIGTADNNFGFTNEMLTDQVGDEANPIDPQLGPLEMNGGPTPTQALLPGSPAINQGNCFGIHRDQRGYDRPWYHPPPAKVPGGDGSDIGAYEFDSKP